MNVVGKGLVAVDDMGVDWEGELQLRMVRWGLGGGGVDPKPNLLKNKFSSFAHSRSPSLGPSCCSYCTER